MSVQIAALLAMSIFAVSLQGWGGACRRVFGLSNAGHWSTTLPIGLAVLVFFGGILNVIALATPYVLLALVAGGVILAVLSRRRTDPGFPQSLWTWPVRPEDVWQRGAAYGLIAIIFIFAFATQLSPREYNMYDDFQKYFTVPVRMIQTGSVFGGPLDSMGTGTLGGLAFLQGIVLAAFPITYINAVDAIFGLLLCLVLANQFIGGGKRDWATTLVSSLAILCVALINPQYVNVSALYLGSAIIMALIALSADARELKENGEPCSPAVMGLLYAALIALKPTYVIFVAIHLPLVALSLAVFGRSFAQGFRWGARGALYTALFVSPWIALYASNYFAGLYAPAPETLVQENHVEALDIFSAKPLYYGASIVHYTGLVAIAAVVAAISGWVVTRSNDRVTKLSAQMVLVAAFTAAPYFFAFVVILGPRLFGSEDSVRYFTPIAIGITPALVGLTGFHVNSLAHSRWPKALMLLPIGLGLFPILSFWPSFIDRSTQAYDLGSILAFSETAHLPEYLAYNQQVLHGDVAAKIRAAQATIPAGAPMMAWVNAPFYLDYSRNPIFDIDIAGLANPWAKVPKDRYVIWEYKGLATRTDATYRALSVSPGRQDRIIAARARAQIEDFLYAANHGQQFYDDGNIVAFLPPQPLSPHEAPPDAK